MNWLRSTRYYTDALCLTILLSGIATGWMTRGLIGWGSHFPRRATGLAPHQMGRLTMAKSPPLDLTDNASDRYARCIAIRETAAIILADAILAGTPTGELEIDYLAAVQEQAEASAALSAAIAASRFEDPPARAHVTVEELLALVALARARGIYESDPDWEPIDEALRQRGFDLTPRTD